MGYHIHHTISVTSWNGDTLREALEFAASTGAKVSGVVESNINGIASFHVAPDGSKEGWEESAQGDARRDRIKSWLRSKAYEDGSTSLKWFEVAHPEDGAPRVIDHQNKREGYSYGEDALEQVRFGWELAVQAMRAERLEQEPQGAPDYSNDPRLAEALANPPGPKHARVVETGGALSNCACGRVRQWLQTCPVCRTAAPAR